MRTLALIVSLLACTACQSFTWQGRGAGVTPEQYARGLQSVDSLAASYETQRFYRDSRRRMDGRANAFSRGLTNIRNTVDRHIFNYNQDDPTLNFPSGREGFLTATGRVSTGVFNTMLMPLR